MPKAITTRGARVRVATHGGAGDRSPVVAGHAVVQVLECRLQHAFRIDVREALARRLDQFGEAAEGIVVITHAGAGGSDKASDRGSPAALRTALDAVPELTLIACHFGGYHRLSEADQLIVGTRAYLETSWPPRLADLDADRIRHAQLPRIGVTSAVAR